MKAKENRPVKKVHLTNFHIAGFGFWDGAYSAQRVPGVAEYTVPG